MDSQSVSERFGVDEEEVGLCAQGMKLVAMEGNVLVTTTPISTIEVIQNSSSKDELVFNVQTRFLKKLLNRELNVSDLTSKQKDMKVYVVLDLPKELFSEEVMIATHCKEGLYFVCRDDIVMEPLQQFVPKIIDHTEGQDG